MQIKHLQSTVGELEVLFVNHYSTDYLLQAIRSIRSELGVDIPIIVVDNASPDIKLLQITHPKITLIRNRVNRGFAWAVNQGIKAGERSFVLIMNPDSILLDAGVLEATKYLKSHPRVGVAGLRVWHLNGRLQDSARRFHRLSTFLAGQQGLLTRFFPTNRFTQENLVSKLHDSQPYLVDWVAGSCMLARRDALESVGGLDQRFFMYFEDTDLCQRLWKAGWEVIYFPQANAAHHIGGSQRKGSLTAFWHFHRSCYFYIRKHLWPNQPWLALFAAYALALRMLFLAPSKLLLQLKSK